jgi:putative spermidine/putrescine transport system substrate-binding protein
MFMFDQTINILANGPEKELAYRYANFLLSPEVQALLMREFFVSPTNQKVVVPADLRQDVPVSGADMAKILTWDWDFVNANQTRLGESWAKTFS